MKILSRRIFRTKFACVICDNHWKKEQFDGRIVYIIERAGDVQALFSSSEKETLKDKRSSIYTTWLISIIIFSLEMCSCFFLSFRVISDLIIGTLINILNLLSSLVNILELMFFFWDPNFQIFLACFHSFYHFYLIYINYRKHMFKLKEGMIGDRILNCKYFRLLNIINIREICGKMSIW